MIDNESSIWKKLGYALVLTLPVTIVGLIIITIIGELDRGITALQSKSLWWVLFIIGFILSVIYAFAEPKIKKYQNRKKLLFMSLLYWEEQLAKRNKPKPTKLETALMEKYLIDRMTIMGWFDPEYWNECYPNEKYTESLFELIDNHLIHLEKFEK